MKTDFLNDFIKEVDYEYLYHQAQKEFTSLPYSEYSEGRVQSLQDMQQKLQELGDEQSLPIIQGELTYWHEYGDRVLKSENAEGIFEKVISLDEFYHDYMIEEIRRVSYKLFAAFRTFVNDINLGGLSQAAKVDHLLNILYSADHAAYLRLDLISIYTDVNLYILAIIDNFSSEVIEELGKVGKSASTKYNFKKVAFSLKSVRKAEDDASGLPEINRKEESFYLFRASNERTIDQETSVSEPASSDDTNHDDAFEEFIKNRPELCRLSVGDRKVFDEESLHKLFSSLKVFSSGPKETIPKINIDIPGLKKGVFGEAIYTLFQSSYFTGSKSEFEDYIKKAFLWRGNNIESTASFRNSGYQKKGKRP